MTSPLAGLGLAARRKQKREEQQQQLQPQPTQMPRMAKTKASPEFAQYLRNQSLNILLGGGSEEDVAQFIQLELERELPPRVPTTADLNVETPSLVRGLAMNALQGITFGFGDEAMGALLGLMTGEGARGGIGTYRKELKAFAEARPGVSLPAQIAGGLLTGAALYRAGAALTGAGTRAAAEAALGLPKVAPGIVQRGLAAAGQGAAFGAAFGAGEAEGDLTLEGVSNRTRSALFGGAAGAITAGALVSATRVAGTVLQPVARVATNWSRALQARLPGIGTPEQQAREMAWRALREDGINLDEALKRVLNFERTGSPAGLADIGGESTMALVQQSLKTRTPNKTKLVEMLIGREEQQAERLSAGMFQQIFRGNKFGLRNAYEAAESLDAARRSAARPLYTEAHQQVAQVTDRMKTLFKKKPFRQAWEVGRRIGNEEIDAGIANPGALKIPKLPSQAQTQMFADNPQAQAALNRALAEQGIAQFPAELPVRGLDLMKRGLDAVIERGLKKGKLEGRAAAALRAQLDDVLGQLDEQVPVYGEARGVYRGFTEMMDALELGRDFLKKAPEIVRRELGVVEPQARDFYRLGAAQSLYEQVTSGAKRNVAQRYFGGRLFGGSSVEGQRLRMLFPDAPEVADDFMRQIAAESRLSFSAQRTLSPARSAGVEKVEEVLEGTIPTVRATPGVMLANIARSGVVKTRSQWSNDVSDELALLFSRGLGNPSELRSLLSAIDRAGQGVVRRGRLRSLPAMGIGQVLGTVTGSQF